jgi:hypothetical protein
MGGSCAPSKPIDKQLSPCTEKVMKEGVLKRYLRHAKPLRKILFSSLSSMNKPLEDG